MAEAEIRSLYPARIVEDLARSGLEPADIAAKILGPAEKQATGAPSGADGYVIPYYDINGHPEPFYRVKLFDQPAKAPRYLQLADSQNHVYFPPRLQDLIGTAKYMLLTEGEKKAAAAVKLGFPCVALSGVDSWRSRTLILPGDSKLAKRAEGGISVRLPGGSQPGEVGETLARGLTQLIGYVAQRNIPIIFVYDTDTDANPTQGLWKFEVQRAASALAFELRFRGVPLRNIRSMVLSPTGAGKKTGLDDFLADPECGPDALGREIKSVLSKPSAFPRHPNVRGYVNDRLRRASIPRQDQMALSMAILSDLDCRGQRLISEDDSFYYFSREDKTLSPVEFSGRPEFARSSFGRRLYREYNLGINDQRVLGWLSTQFSGEEPIAKVSPERILTWRGDTLYFQVNDGSMAKITKDDISLLDNGQDNVLFESGLIEPDSAPETQDFGQLLKAAQQAPLNNWWYETLQETRIKDSDGDLQRKLLSLLYYISPMFYRWRNTQLPVEITTGEAGSGKSTLFQLRLDILTGEPKLRNAPNDLRDWGASIGRTGGLHVTDNVQLLNNDLRQRLSDEICRLITDAHPSIEARKLYTTNEVVNTSVKCVFALTALRMPFQNVDIIQRSIITELDKGTDEHLRYDAEWWQHQLQRRGGRAAWLAHHLVVVQRMLQLIHTQWQPRYQAQYRLINVEQLLQLAARTFDWEHSWIPNHLEASRDKRVSESDWALEGLGAFAESVRQQYPENYETRKFSAADITDWAKAEEEFEKCDLLINTRALGRHMNSNKHTLATTVHIIPAGNRQNRQMFSVRRHDQ
jgi:hypothetical protein